MAADPSRRDAVERRLLLQEAISRALADSETVEEALPRVLAAIGEHMDWRLGVFWLLDQRAGVLRAAEMWGNTEQLHDFVEATRAREFTRGEGLPGHVWETGEPTWVQDVLGFQNFPRHELAAKAGLHAAVAFPVRVGTSFLGAVEFFNADVQQPSRPVLRAAEGIGLQIGQFIDRKRAVAAERDAEIRNAAMLETALDCIISIDTHGRVLEWNPSAERTFGYRRAEVLGREMAELIIPPSYREAHYHGLRRYLDTGEARVMGKRIEVVGMRADRSEIPLELTITRVPVSGEPVFTAYLRDLSEQKKLESGERLVLSASTLLASSLDYETTLRNLRDVVIPEFADWYAVDLLEGDNTLRRLEVAHRDPAKMRLAQELAARYPPGSASAAGAQHVVRTGESELVSDISVEGLDLPGMSSAHTDLLRSLGLRSYIVVPLRLRERILGAMTLVTAESGRRYDARDLATAEELARRASQAIDNARLFREVAETREQLEQQATELESQAEELEHTAAELEMSNEELRDTNEELAKRTHESEGARRDAEQARAEADEANRAKSEFLAAMSHELRTPLNAIMGYTQILDVGIHGAVSDDQRTDLRRITRSAQHLLGLITDILNFAKVEAGRLEYKLRPLEIGTVLNGVEDLVGPQAAAKNVTYSFHDHCNGACVCADQDKLLQIMVNLLSNAVQFTEPGGEIEVSCSANDHSVTTLVRDTGVGIPAGKLEAIFEPFVQVDREYAGQRQGTGLGLAISRELARAMGGELTAASDVGVGSVFTLELPLAD